MEETEEKKSLWDFYNKCISEDNGKRAQCRICNNVYSYNSTIHNLKAHLYKKHKDVLPCDTDVSLSNLSKTLTSKAQTFKWGQLRKQLSEYFTVEDPEERLATCNSCKKTISFKTTTGNLKSHLRRKHQSLFVKLYASDDEETTEEDLSIVYGDIVKNKWKTLRDGFTKNKKQLKEKGLMKTYTWAPQLAFLENYVLQKQPTIDLTPSSPISMDSDPFASIEQIPSEKELPLEDTAEPIEKPAAEIPTKKSTKRKISEDEDDITRIINFLSKKKNKDDAISHLFLSYAETFREFPVNEQISLKVQLAKLFSHAELKLAANADKNQYILSTNEDQNLLQMEDEDRVTVKIESEDNCAQYYLDDEPLRNIHHQHKEIKTEAKEINQDNGQSFSKQLQSKEDELKKANEQLASLNKELEALKTRNTALETRNANLEAAVDDLKMRLNNLV